MKQVPEAKLPFLTFYRMAKHDPIGLRTKIFSTYGDIAWRKVGRTVNYYIAHPEYAKHILQDNQDNYLHKHPLAQLIFSPIIGMNSLFVTNDLTQWYKDRITANIVFDPKVYFQDYAATVTLLCNQMLDRWSHHYTDAQYINIAQEIDPLIISIIAETLFTKMEVDPELFVSKITKMASLLKKKLHTPALAWYFLPASYNYRHTRQFIKNLMDHIVMKRLNGDKNWDDLLGYLLVEHKDFSKAEMISLVSYQIASFFAVGYFTTSALLQWLLVELSYHPDVERKIEQEVKTVVGDRSPTFSDLSSLRYLSSVIKEVLRLHPTSFVIMRQAIANDTMAEFSMPKDAGIILSTYHIHRHPDFWANPEGFDPERFNNNPLGQKNPFAYIPFGGGKRRCIGPTFSTLEATLIIAMISQKFRFHLPPYAEIKPRITTITTMRPTVTEMRLQFK